MYRIFAFFAYGFLLFVVGGCSNLNVTEVSPDKFAAFHPETVCERELKSGDVLSFSVEVDGKPEILSRRATVDHEGRITVPLVGDLQVAGRILSEVRNVLKTTYSGFYVSEPLVTLILENEPDEGAWGTVTVLGQVENPGSVPLTASSLRLSEAIQRAGGFASGARQDAVRVSRMSSEGRQVQCVIDFRLIGQMGLSDSDLKLFPGDVVYVPERIF